MYGTSITSRYCGNVRGISWSRRGRLKHIASLIHGYTALTKKLLELRIEVQTTEYFDTLTFRMKRISEPVATKLWK